jgi:glycosyltransferase involved in cell wall biosynthesis
MRIVQLITDDRENSRQYDRTEPFFGAAATALLQGFAAMPETEVHVISCAQRPLPAPEKLAANIWFHELHVPKLGWMRTGYQGCVRAVRCRVRELRPDIVHGQGTERDSAMSAVFSGFPNVLTIHGIMSRVARAGHAPIGSFHWLAARLENFVLPRAAGVLCNSRYTEECIRPRARRTWRVPNAVRLEFFAAPAPAQRPGEPVLINVGTIAPHKRQRELLEIASRLHWRGLKFEFWFVGALDTFTEYGRAFAGALAAAQELGFARHIRFQDSAALMASLDAAAAMVHWASEESFGLAVAEGLARNLKFFGPRVGGIPDIAEGVEGAELFDPDAVEALEAALAGWLERGCPRPANAATSIASRFHPQAVARRHLEIYREVLSTAS